jgi:hypothetical protein
MATKFFFFLFLITFLSYLTKIKSHKEVTKR